MNKIKLNVRSKFNRCKLSFLELKLYHILSVILLVNFLISCTKSKIPITSVKTDCQDTIKFSTKILPIISGNCFSCHNGGILPTLNDHATISSNAEKIVKALKADGAPLMPQGGPPLNDSLIEQFQCWVNQGKQNN